MSAASVGRKVGTLTPRGHQWRSPRWSHLTSRAADIAWEAQAHVTWLVRTVMPSTSLCRKNRAKHSFWSGQHEVLLLFGILSMPTEACFMQHHLHDFFFCLPFWSLEDDCRKLEMQIQLRKHEECQLPALLASTDAGIQRDDAGLQATSSLGIGIALDPSGQQNVGQTDCQIDDPKNEESRVHMWISPWMNLTVSLKCMFLALQSFSCISCCKHISLRLRCDYFSTFSSSTTKITCDAAARQTTEFHLASWPPTCSLRLLMNLMMHWHPRAVDIHFPDSWQLTDWVSKLTDARTGRFPSCSFLAGANGGIESNDVLSLVEVKNHALIPGKYSWTKTHPKSWSKLKSPTLTIQKPQKTQDHRSWRCQGSAKGLASSSKAKAVCHTEAFSHAPVRQVSNPNRF